MNFVKLSYLLKTLFEAATLESSETFTGGPRAIGISNCERYVFNTFPDRVLIFSFCEDLIFSNAGNYQNAQTLQG